MKIKLNKKDTVLVHDDAGHVKRVPKSKVPELLKRKGWGLAEAKVIDHQHRIARDTVKNPLKGKFLGGPSAEEAENTLRTKYKYTDKQIAKLKEEVLNELSPELLKRYIDKTGAKTAKQYNAGDSAGLQKTGRGIGSAAMRLGGITPKKIAALKLKYLEKDHSDWGDTQRNEEVLPGEGSGWHKKPAHIASVAAAKKRRAAPGQRNVYKPKGPINTSHLSLAHYEPEGDMLDEGKLKNTLIGHGDAIHSAAQRHSNLLMRKDHKSLAKLASHIEAGNIKQARSHYENLDTAVKDVVPMNTRKFLYREETISEGRPFTHHDYLEDAEREAMRADALRTRQYDPRHKKNCKHPMKYRVHGECGNCGATKAELKEETLSEVSRLHRAGLKKVKVDVSTLRQRARALAGKVEQALADYDEVVQDEIDYASRQAHPRKIALVKNLVAVKAEERAWLNGLAFALKKGSFDVAAKTYKNLSPDVRKILPPEIEQFLGMEGLGGVYEDVEADELLPFIVEAAKVKNTKKTIKKVLDSKSNTPSSKPNKIEFNPSVSLTAQGNKVKQPNEFVREEKKWNPKDALYTYAKRPKSAGKPWGFNPITGEKFKKKKKTK